MRMKFPDDGAAQVLMLLSNSFDPDPRPYAEARALIEHGCRVLILAWDRDRKRPPREAVDGIEVERIHFQSTHGRGGIQIFFLAAVWLAMMARVRKHCFDIVHAHDFDMLPVGFLLSRLRGKPLVYDSHEDYAGMLHGSIPRWMEWCIRTVESWLVRRVDLLITVGEKLRAEFGRRGCGRSLVVGNWKEPTAFRLDEATRRVVRAELGVPDQSLLVSYVSHLGRDRRIVELLEAVSRRPEVHLVVGGIGPQEDLVREYAARYTNIHYLGYVDPKDVPRHTWAADLLYYGFNVQSPNARYSAPNKLFEALAAGRPLLSGRFGEIERIVSEHDCGILVKEFSTPELLRALDRCADRKQLERWKQHAAQLGEHVYNWARAEQCLLDAYREFCPMGAAPGALPRRESEKVVTA